MKKLLIATLAVFFFIGFVQADDEPLEEPTIEETQEFEPEITEEVIDEIIIEETPEVEPEEVYIDEVTEEYSVLLDLCAIEPTNIYCSYLGEDASVLPDGLLDEELQSASERYNEQQNCFATKPKYKYCATTYIATQSGANVTVQKRTYCPLSCENGFSSSIETVAVYMGSTEMYGY